MAPPNQESQGRQDADRARLKRLAWFTVIGFMLIAWGPRTAIMVEKGWSSSRLALERQAQIDENARRLDALQREVAYARTSEGRDVEAKRRFGVGPQDEIWIAVEAEVPPEQRPEAQSVADRMESWLGNAGGRFLDRVREVGGVVGYAVGLSDVGGHVAVPVVEEIELPDISGPDEPEAVPPVEDAGHDDEAAGDESAQQ